ncbi:hypothetical protein GCM10010228_72850 [Streptomyces massasporeus]|nr:hypothetical protein GCM10010228_72850 [Streptomyces massasporeus]
MDAMVGMVEQVPLPRRNDMTAYAAERTGGASVRIGALAPLTRPGWVQAGQHLLAGMGLAVSEANDAGGITGRPGGTVWGGGALAMTRADGGRQMSVAVNLQRRNRLDASGRPQPHSLDDALVTLYREAMYG